MQTKLDFAKLAFSHRLQEQIRTKLGDGPPGVRRRVSYGRRVGVDVTISGLIIGRLLLMLGGDDLVGRPLSSG